MRPVSEWTEADLQALVDGQEPESLMLEFKRLRALDSGSDARRELSKDVSAMANSAGGRIIYGIRERRVGATAVAESLDDDPDAPKVTPETLEQRIYGSIEPRPQGLAIKAIPLTNGNTAFVIDVPAAASIGPHQANDRKYYRRFNFQCEAMHDYEIRDVMRRGTTPHLGVEISVVSADRSDEEQKLKLKVRVSINNRSSEPALYYSLALYVDERLTMTALRRLSPSGTSMVRLQDAQVKCARIHANFLPSNAMPVFREGNFYIEEFGLTVPLEPKGYALGYTVATPGFFGQGVALLAVSPDGVAAVHPAEGSVNG